MLFAEDNQEVADMHPQAYKIGENPEIMLPVMINMDGFILTHAMEPIEIPGQKEVDEFLPPYQPEYCLDVKAPKTFGNLAEPQWYAETRYKLQDRESSRRFQGQIRTLPGRPNPYLPHG
jgi:pyruvate ferredoxin oxidoreductase alpha subunit